MQLQPKERERERRGVKTIDISMHKLMQTHTQRKERERETRVYGNT